MHINQVICILIRGGVGESVMRSLTRPKVGAYYYCGSKSAERKY